ncbi:MAG: hypothetical protein AB7O44_15420 [Hyphomicrobiaceae bacterium]
MATRAQIGRLSSRIQLLAEVIDPNAGLITVAVFRGETPEHAMARRRELRPEHAGRRVRFDFRSNARDDINEWSAVWLGATEVDLDALRSFMAGSVIGVRSFLGFHDDDLAIALSAREALGAVAAGDVRVAARPA